MKHYKLEPAPGKVVVKTFTGERQTDSGVILLSDRTVSRIGRVVAVYEPYVPDEDPNREIESFFKVGDEVIFGRNSGVEIRIERDVYTVLREVEILTKVREVEEDA